MKKRKINLQKIFCFLSFIFLATCVFWYGGRIIYFYLENNKTEVTKTDNLSQSIINENLNKENFKNINQEYYFSGKTDNNYVMYSNILWRIVKITSTKGIVLVTESPITNLAYNNAEKYQESNINKWLNNTDNNTGILEENLNSKETYLIKNKICLDVINDVEEASCKETNEDYFVGLLSLTDYINTGGAESFINNGKYTYLSNTNKDNNIWYLNSEGKVDTITQNEIYGIKPVITLSSENKIISGNGTIDKPYIIEKENGLFGSYVKLDKDIWRIYQVNEDTVKLVLNNYLTINEEKITYQYSKNNYYHNDTKNETLAYYLNKTYLNTLTYKDKINTDYWPNYYYSEETKYDHNEIFKNKIDTKVSILSVGDIILNNELDNYFLNTGTSKNSNKVYVVNNDGSLSIRNVTLKSNIVPCISINKDLLTKGSGTENDPYETE